MTLPDKVQAIKHIAVPTNKKHLRSFYRRRVINIEICANTDQIS